MTNAVETDVLLNRLRIAGWGAAGLLLLLPLVAMQFTGEVNWTGSDFAVFGAMLLTAGGACELGARLSRNWSYRLGTGLAVGTGFLLVWINLAVGIIGSENNAANGMYAGVLGIGVVGALLSRFRASGLKRTLITMAIGQVTVSLIALVVFQAFTLVLDGVFAGLWLASAWQFGRAAQARVQAVEQR